MRTASIGRWGVVGVQLLLWYWSKVVHNGRMNTNLSPPSPPNIRLTIPVSPEVHATFQRLSKARSISIGRAMGEWLGDTVDAAGYMAVTLERARAAPKLVAQELHAYAIGMAEESGAFLAKIRAQGRSDVAAAAGRAGADSPAGGKAVSSPIPPPCNTGGKLPRVNPNKGKS